jgi:hypothetical protein
VEVAQQTNCTLVEVRSTPTTPIEPFAYGAQVTTTGGTTMAFTFVNSCLVAGSPSAAGSSIAVVIGGASFGVTNRATVEIYPAPGSDDDARVDIRIRDANNIPVQNAHVTLLTDKPIAMAMFQNTGALGTQYTVVAPSSTNFGTPYGGDTCDQVLTQSITSGSITTPFLIPALTGTPAAANAVDGFTNLDGIVSACLYANPDFSTALTPGTINLTAIVESPGGLGSFVGAQCSSFAYPAGTTALFPCAQFPTNIVLTGTVKIVGPVASLAVAASPTTVNCGEKSTITVTAKDAAGQNVSDNTQIELITNAGGVLGGTGSTLGFPGVPPTGPLSSAAASTVNGVATAYLLTSTEHQGPYEVVAAGGGGTGSWVDSVFNNYLSQAVSGNIVAGNPGFANLSAFLNSGSFAGGNVPPGAVVSSQVTVNCSVPSAAVPAPAPSVTAPRTGTGPSILPPNTGDAGLAASSSSSSSALFAIAGVAAFALAGLATLKFARR